MIERTLQQDVELAIREIIARHPGLDATRTGTIVNTIAGMTALQKREAIFEALRQVSRTFIETARADDLNLLAWDHFALERHPATAAVGHVRIVVNSGTLELPAGAIATDEAGVQYRTTAPVTVAPPAVVVPVESVNAGRAYNRPDNAILFFPALTSLPAVARTHGPLAGANPAETDDDFRTRIRAWWRSLRRGTAEAIRFVALSVPTIRRAEIDEQHIRPNRGGFVDLFVTDSSDSYNLALAAQVRLAVDTDARAAGVVLNIHGAQLVYVDVTATFTLRAGHGPATLARALDAARNHLNNLRIGETLHRARLIAAMVNADNGIANVSLALPVADIAPNTNQVLRAGRIVSA